MTPEEKWYFVMANEYLDFLCFLEDELNDFEEVREKFIKTQESDVLTNEAHVCKVCGQPFLNRDDYYEHYDETHNHPPI